MKTGPIIVFDLDGTLAWTEKYWLPVMAEVVEHINAENNWTAGFSALEDILTHLGKPAEEIMAFIYPQATTAEIDHILEVKADLWRELLGKYPFELFPGVLETLAQLREMGFRQYVSSNCDEIYLDRMLTTTGIGEFMDDAACLGMYPKWEKKDFTRKMLESVEFERGAFVGDSFHDMHAGRHNGLTSIFADYGYGQSAPDLIDLRLDQISSLPSLLANW